MHRFMKKNKQKHCFAIMHVNFSENQITKILFHIPLIIVFQKKKKLLGNITIFQMLLIHILSIKVVKP